MKLSHNCSVHHWTRLWNSSHHAILDRINDFSATTARLLCFCSKNNENVKTMRRGLCRVHLWCNFGFKITFTISTHWHFPIQNTNLIKSDVQNSRNFKHEYLRSGAYICLSLSSPFSVIVIQIWPLLRYSCLYLGFLHPRNFSVSVLS